MKKIKIKAIITNSENETTSIQTIAEYDEINKIIKYKEEELEVTINLYKDKILLNRKSNDYDINFDFQKNKQIMCTHKITSLGIDLDMKVDTMKLDIKDNYIYVQYSLYNSKENIGIFEYKLMILN